MKKTAVAPDELPSQIFSGIGRCHWYDQVSENPFSPPSFPCRLPRQDPYLPTRSFSQPRLSLPYFLFSPYFPPFHLGFIFLGALAFHTDFVMSDTPLFGALKGTFAVLVRAGTAPLAYNAMVQGFAAIAHCLPDFIKYNKER